MKATGLFFLRMHACIARNRAGERVVMLRVIERDANDHRVVLNELLVKWKGAEAERFFDTHENELRAGRPLLLELDRLGGRDGEWQAYATHCAFAPIAPSWQARTGKDDSPQPQAHGA